MAESCAVLRFHARFFATILFVCSKWKLEGNSPLSTPTGSARNFPDISHRSLTLDPRRMALAVRKLSRRKLGIAESCYVRSSWLGVFGDYLSFEASSMRDGVVNSRTCSEACLAGAC